MAHKSLSYFNILPPELHEKIFEYCSQSDLVSLLCCNKAWKRMLKSRVWRTVRIPYSSLVRKNFSFYASKKKFKRLRHCRSVCFVDDTKPTQGSMSCHTKPKEGSADEEKCPENFYKLLEYLDAQSLDHVQLQGLFVNPDSVKICIQMFPHVRKLAVCGHSNTHVLSPDVFTIISHLYCLRELNFGGVLVRLDILNVGNTNMSKVGAVDLTSLSDLTELTLTDCNVKNIDLSVLRELRSLQRINLSCSSSIYDAEVAHLCGLPVLRELVLSCCGVTDEGLKHISSITTLQHLNIQSTQVTDDGMMSLQKLPNLRLLDVSACINMGDYGVLHISEMVSLRRLNISALNVTQYGFMLCAVLPHLRHLDVQGCYPLRDDSMTHVRRFPCLEVLNISNNRITDEGLADICRSTTLKHLLCKHTNISEEAVQRMDQRVTVEHDTYTRTGTNNN